MPERFFTGIEFRKIAVLNDDANCHGTSSSHIGRPFGATEENRPFSLSALRVFAI